MNYRDDDDDEEYDDDDDGEENGAGGWSQHQQQQRRQSDSMVHAGGVKQNPLKRKSVDAAADAGPGEGRNGGDGGGSRASTSTGLKLGGATGRPNSSVRKYFTITPHAEDPSVNIQSCKFCGFEKVSRQIQTTNFARHLLTKCPQVPYYVREELDNPNLYGNSVTVQRIKAPKQMEGQIFMPFMGDTVAANYSRLYGELPVKRPRGRPPKNPMVRLQEQQQRIAAAAAAAAAGKKILTTAPTHLPFMKSKALPGPKAAPKAEEHVQPEPQIQQQPPPQQPPQEQRQEQQPQLQQQKPRAAAKAANESNSALSSETPTKDTILKMIVGCGLPLRIVESIHFREFVAALNPQAASTIFPVQGNHPSLNTHSFVASSLPSLHEHVSRKVKSMWAVERNIPRTLGLQNFTVLGTSHGGSQNSTSQSFFTVSESMSVSQRRVAFREVVVSPVVDASIKSDPSNQTSETEKEQELERDKAQAASLVTVVEKLLTTGAQQQGQQQLPVSWAQNSGRLSAAAAGSGGSPVADMYCGIILDMTLASSSACSTVSLARRMLEEKYPKVFVSTVCVASKFERFVHSVLNDIPEIYTVLKKSNEMADLVWRHTAIRAAYKKDIARHGGTLLVRTTQQHKKPKSNDNAVKTKVGEDGDEEGDGHRPLFTYANAHLILSHMFGPTVSDDSVIESVEPPKNIVALESLLESTNQNWDFEELDSLQDLEILLREPNAIRKPMQLQRLTQVLCAAAQHLLEEPVRRSTVIGCAAESGSSIGCPTRASWIYPLFDALRKDISSWAENPATVALFESDTIAAVNDKFSKLWQEIQDGCDFFLLASLLDPYTTPQSEDDLPIDWLQTSRRMLRRFTVGMDALQSAEMELMRLVRREPPWGEEIEIRQQQIQELLDANNKQQQPNTFASCTERIIAGQQKMWPTHLIWETVGKRQFPSIFPVAFRLSVTSVTVQDVQRVCQPVLQHRLTKEKLKNQTTMQLLYAFANMRLLEKKKLPVAARVVANHPGTGLDDGEAESGLADFLAQSILEEVEEETLDGTIVSASSNPVDDNF